MRVIGGMVSHSTKSRNRLRLEILMGVPKALIVDDDPKFLTFISRTLKRGGFAVRTASDGCEAAELVNQLDIDLLVLDLQMPGMNGWEVIRHVRDHETPSTPVTEKPKHPKRMKIVVVSGRNEDDTAAFVRRLGADAYVTKPVWGADLLATVRAVMER